jgi:integrase
MSRATSRAQRLLSPKALNPPAVRREASRLWKQDTPVTCTSSTVDVVTVSNEDVEKLYAATEAWDGMLCLACLTYLGSRRTATARARRQDVNLERGTIRFREKGDKVIVKPLPSELVAILRAAEENGVWSRPSDYLIPNHRAPRRKGERCDKVIYAIVKRLAGRAGVNVHPHALRSAYAVRYGEQHPGDLDALQKLLGHARPETTQVTSVGKTGCGRWNASGTSSRASPCFRPLPICPRRDSNPCYSLERAVT